MKYLIEVHSLGYEDTSTEVGAVSRVAASSKANIQKAIIAWCDHNALDINNDSGLPFTRVIRLLPADIGSGVSKRSVGPILTTNRS